MESLFSFPEGLFHPLQRAGLAGAVRVADKSESPCGINRGSLGIKHLLWDHCKILGSGEWHSNGTTSLIGLELSGKNSHL